MGVCGPDFTNVAYHEGLIYPTFLLHTHYHTRRMGKFEGSLPFEDNKGGQHLSTCCDS